jgi:hypothetical protein
MSLAFHAAQIDFFRRLRTREDQSKIPATLESARGGSSPKPCELLINKKSLVAGGGIEPPTLGL